jgi:hypothetical protein
MRGKSTTFEGVVGKHEGKEEFTGVSVNGFILLKWILMLESF